MDNKFFGEFKKISNEMVYLLEQMATHVDAGIAAEIKSYSGDKSYGYSVVSMQHEREQIAKLTNTVKKAQMSLGGHPKKISWWDYWVEIPLRNWIDLPPDEKNLDELVGF